MKQSLHIQIGGIKCDTENCDHQDDSVKVGDYEVDK